MILCGPILFYLSQSGFCRTMNKDYVVRRCDIIFLFSSVMHYIILICQIYRLSTEVDELLALIDIINTHEKFVFS